MEHQSQSNGLRTFTEHWWLAITALVAIVCSLILNFFTDLCGQPWIDFFVAGMALLITGASLIACAKMPAYRNGQFFTFGIKSVPKSLTGYYRWGWCVFLTGVALSLCLLLSNNNTSHHPG